MATYAEPADEQAERLAAEARIDRIRDRIRDHRTPGAVDPASTHPVDVAIRARRENRR